MTDWPYPTAFSLWGEEERAAIARVHASGRYTMGAETEAFEGELAAWHGVRHAVMVNSGSSANLVAVAALTLKTDRPLVRGDRAVVPALAWATTYAPLVQHGLELTLSDCDGTWNAVRFDEDHRPRLVVACSILGVPAYLDQLRAYADLVGAYIIEDNCEAFGGRANGKLCGTFGELGTLSFFHSHHVSAIEGGAVLTDNAELAWLCRLLRNHGNAGWDNPNFESQYDFRMFGYNVRPLEMHAAIARGQLKKQDAFAKARRRNHRYFAEMARGLPIRMQEMRGDPNPFGLAFAVESREQRRALATALRAEGIDCRPPTGGSFTRHPYGAPWRDQETPHADGVHDTGLFLGNAPFSIDAKIEKAIKVMRRVL